jgi:hypothetical protein
MKTSITGILLFIPIAISIGQEPDRFSVAAGFVPTDDGSYHVVILMSDAITLSYCGAGWSAGVVQTEFKDASKVGGVTTNPSGCWAASSSDPSKTTITFRYFEISDGKVKQFKIDPSQMHRMIYEWRTERLFPIARS